MDRVSRFNSAVEAFLREKYLSAVSDIVHQNLIGEFLATPAIGAYLTRPSTDISFDAQGEPVIESPYERQLYEACRDSKAAQIPFRAQKSNMSIMRDGANIEAESTAFYHSGTNKDGEAALYRTLHQQTLPHQGEAQNPLAAHIYVATNGYDVYQISGVLRHLQKEPARHNNLRGELRDANNHLITLPNTGTSFLIFPSGRDAHAITFFAVVDNAANKVIRTGLCNSWHSESYAKQVKHRMNTDVGQEDHPDLKPFPFIDCSHHLQKSNTDLNCGLYRSHFARALTDMLYHEPKLRELLANPSVTDTDVTAQVRDGMKAYLPEYYHRNGTEFVEATEDEKRAVHLHDRWEVGNEFLRNKIAEFKQKDHPIARA